MITEIALRNLLIDVYLDLKQHEQVLNEIRTEVLALSAALAEIGDSRFSAILQRHKQRITSESANGFALKQSSYDAVLNSLQNEKNF